MIYTIIDFTLLSVSNDFSANTFPPYLIITTKLVAHPVTGALSIHLAKQTNSL